MFDRDSVMGWVKTHFVRKRDLANGRVQVGGLVVGASGTQVIASGVITIPPGVTVVTVDTEGAAAADDLDTIEGGVTGQIIVVHSTVSFTRVVTLKDTTGNLRLAGDMVLNSVLDNVTLYLQGSNTWVELSRSDNA